MNPLQECFDKSTSSLIAQGSKSFNNGLCYHRLTGDDGIIRKCAIGWLITDEQIVKYNINSTDDVRSFNPKLFLELLSEIDYDLAHRFLSSMQEAHDKADPKDFVKSFMINANNVAFKFGLNPIA